MPLETNTQVGADVLKREWDEMYSRVSTTLTNNTLATQTVADMVGMPVKLNGAVWELALNADVATIDGVVIDGPPINALANAATTTEKYVVLMRGPAVINEDALQANDPAGTPWTTATLKTSLEGLSPPIKLINEPTKISTQTE